MFINKCKLFLSFTLKEEQIFINVASFAIILLCLDRLKFHKSDARREMWMVFFVCVVSCSARFDVRWQDAFSASLQPYLLPLAQTRVAMAIQQSDCCMMAEESQTYFLWSASLSACAVEQTQLGGCLYDP